MSSDQKKSLDELMQKLSADSRAKVVDFADYLFEKDNAQNDPEFIGDLKAACEHTFERYRQSYYDSWEDLQQEVLLRLCQWRPKYRGKRRTILQRIATNLLIDAARKENANRRYPNEIVFANQDNRMPPDSAAKPARKLKQNWAGGLNDYSSQYTSLELQKKALEWRGD